MRYNEDVIFESLGGCGVASIKARRGGSTASPISPNVGQETAHKKWDAGKRGIRPTA